ncbi:NAD+ synthase [Paracoccus alkenifer]|uniref:Glutamine-dependent NAD(+) synthetase n=1 Tax=Paracoccus alkenifer TaxID=65735 RepID=A0A1H6M422_9RHOB|nr:NAD+ synthase [Paracoccus alkenifer]SEH96006.1 NH(3)-dependent NAD(+) synthetase [Paracoccus alkenifer]
MTDRFRLTIAQLNPTLGDLPGNAALAVGAWQQAQAAGAQMLALPARFLSGSPAGDLARNRGFLDDCRRTVEKLAADCANGPAIGIGAPWRVGARVHDAWLVLQGGRVTAQVLRHGGGAVFDPAPISGPFAVDGLRLGCTLGDDALSPEVAETLAETGAEILICPAADPYHRSRHDQRISHMVARVVETGLPLVQLNLTGGQAEWVHDGASFVLDPGGHKRLQLPPFQDAVAHVDFTRGPEGWRAEPGTMAPQPDEWEQDYRAMCMGLGDYMRKSGFSRAVLGLSGGVDSTLVATIAADTLGPENLRAVRLPSVHSSQHSLDDAAEQARRLGIRMDTLPIVGPHQAVTETLADSFAGTTPDLTEENIQSRLRGVLLMALSNKFGELLLTTGNKSEVAVGYSTIYGDMAGGYNPLKDLYKTRVFQTCRWRNENHRDWMRGPMGEVIPPAIIAKPPSAELRPDQTDQDSLPPYEVLDAILEGLIERDESTGALVAQGFDPDTVRRVVRLVRFSEWKRQQAAPGPRLSPRAFGADRHYPLVNAWRDPG